MKIVIELTEEEFKKVQDGRAPVTVMRNAIRNGVPLPKGHGDLVDLDEMIDSFCYGNNYMEISEYDLEKINVVVKADKEVDE